MSESDPAARLRARLDAEMGKRGWDQKDLAAKLSISRSTFNKIYKGSAMRATLSRVEDLQEIESVLRMRRGELLREMGLVAELTETRDRIAAAPELSPAGREAVLALFDYYVAKKAKITPLRPAKPKQAKPKSEAAKKGSPPVVTPDKERPIKDLVPNDPPPKGKRPT